MNILRLFFNSLSSVLKRDSSVAGFKHVDNHIDTDNGKAKFGLIWKPIRKYWRLGVGAAALTFLAGLMAYPAPLIYRYLIDKVILAKNIELLPFAIIALVSVRLLTQILNISMTYVSSLFSRSAALCLREDLTKRMLSLPQSFFDCNSPGYIMTRLDSDLGGAGWLLSSSPLKIGEDFIKLIGGLSLLYYLEWRAGLCVTVVLPIFIVMSHFFSRRQYALAIHQGEEHARSGESVEESISNINTVKAIAGENAIREKIMSHYRKLFRLNIEQHALRNIYQLIVNFFPQIARFLLLVFGAIWIINGEWTLGSLIAAQAYMGFVFSPIQSLAQANIQYQNALASLKRLSQFYSITPEYKPGGRDVNKLNGTIAFEDVFFGYNSGHDVLKSISFTVEPGQRIAVCGESGTGKSTLISLLMRFYIPTQGRVMFDGENAGIYDLKQLRRRIAYVSQEPELFTGTVAENIRMNNSSASDEEITQMLRVVGLEQFISAQRDGVHLMLDDKGTNLSIGQKKRLALARSLISNPDILIFDEPTAELDNETTQGLLDNLNSAINDRTVFVITHDPAITSFCDKSMFIVNGQISGFAPHSELADTSPEYRRLFQLGE
ncbi:MAG: ABC transporter ATP-binding protein [Victivallaceae bacterium]|nr:ABC transporter ATP-binding protein [Victivallaceae bacterium]